MKKVLFSIPVIVGVLVSGCASAPVYEVEKFWKKDEVSLEQAKRDFIICKEKAKKHAERDTQVGGLTENCMQLEGYKWGEYKRRVR